MNSSLVVIAGTVARAAIEDALIFANAQMGVREIDRYCQINLDAKRLLAKGYEVQIHFERLGARLSPTASFGTRMLSVLGRTG